MCNPNICVKKCVRLIIVGYKTKIHAIFVLSQRIYLNVIVAVKSFKEMYKFSIIKIHKIICYFGQKIKKSRWNLINKLNFINIV